jgi:hypothetical protein
MKLIAHRGNIHGAVPELENGPDYIQGALDRGYDAEVDVWFKSGWWLGHDAPQYEIDFSFLQQPDLWIHCKNYEALKKLIPSGLNFFYHTDEDYALTSKLFIWAYPGKPGNDHTICVMPDRHTIVDGFAGVCSDDVSRYR